MDGGFEILQRPARASAVRLLEDARLPADDLTVELVEDFFCIGSRTSPVGLVGLEVRGEHALLRSLVVASGIRSRGAGTALVGSAERYARSRGVRELYLLTTTAEDFFARRGYVRIARADAPEAIRATREFAHICPASSAFMRKTLA